MGALGKLDRDYTHYLTPKQTREAAEKYAKLSEKSDHVRRMAITGVGIGFFAGSAAMGSDMSMSDPKTTALALAGSSAVAGVFAYAASKTLESRRRKKILQKFEKYSAESRVLMTNELKHYGILGMKWGKHKVKTSKSSNPSKSSKHYDSLVSKYSQKGYSPQEAAQRAKNRIRTEKALLIAGGTALAAAGSYLTYKKYVKDTVLPNTTIFKQYGSFKPGQSIRNHRNDSFVYDKSDVKGRYSNVRKIQEYLRKDKRGQVFELNSKFDKATTVASPKKARDTFVDKFKNDRHFREDLSEALKRTHAGTDKQDKSIMALRKALSGKKKFLRGDAYDGFTKILKDDNKHANNVKSSYFENLKKQGVNAIVDRDAKKLARTRANRPIIRYGTWGTIPSPEHVTKEHVNYLKNTFKQQRTVKDRIGQVFNEGSKLIRKRKQ